MYYPATPALAVPPTRRFTRPAGIVSGIKLFFRPLWRRLTWGRRTFNNLPA